MIGVHTGKHTQRYADDHGQKQRAERQFEGGGQALEDQAHGVFVINETLAQIAVHGALEKDQVLLPQRLVQPQVRDGLQAFGLIEVFTDQNVHRVADGIQADEHHHRHQQNDQQRLGQATQRPADHGRNSSAVGSLATHSSPSSSGSA
ncbi:hypothetical protein ALP75_203440 [Pseudomonas syringae pv. actinidiae]|nr:hypothetical protein ALP75_203440 [Pseudomonas syringae pv. actinidiae]